MGEEGLLIKSCKKIYKQKLEIEEKLQQKIIKLLK